MNKAAAVPAETRAQKSCLNCRDRKIACDRVLPTCSACKRRKKLCSGYDLNLSWPRDGDQRRAATADVRSPSHGSSAGPVAFLNTSSWDTSLYREYVESGSHKNHMGVWTPAPARSLQSPRFGTNIAPLYDAQVSSAILMIASRGDLRRDVCSLLCRMSLTDNDAPSLAVRHSVNAISYLYLQKSTEAFYHQMLAISALQGVIKQALDPRSRAQAIAASMLLSQYETLGQTGRASNWSVHFDGCMKIARAGHRKHRTYAGEDATLLEWVFYHNVLYKFSIHHWLQRTLSPQIERISRCGMFISKAAFGDHLYTINSTLGCSLQLLDLLSQAVDLVKDRDEPKYLSKSHSLAICRLERDIKDIEQRLSSGIDEEYCHGVGSRKQYTMTARLFQLAVLIYLDRVARGSSASSPVSRNAAKESFATLGDLGVCERPFIMFVLSVQAESDDQRLAILSTLERTTRERPLNNLASTEQMIRRLWAQQDLQGIEQTDALFVLNAVISANSILPSFT